MTPADRKVLNRAARHLSTWALVIQASEIVRTKGHPRYGKFADTTQGHAAERESAEMFADAKALRAIARRKV